MKGIEVGHIFQLGDKYSTAMNSSFIEKSGKTKPVLMGCYGIGISRIVAASIEQNHDHEGIVWPEALCPISLGIILINPHKSDQVCSWGDRIYQKANHLGLQVLLDDREETLGTKFADADLMGVANLIIIGEKDIKKGQFQSKSRTKKQPIQHSLDNIEEYLNEIK